MSLPSSYKIHTPPTTGRVSLDAKVSQLIDNNMGSLDLRVLAEFFNEEQVKAIKTIPLSGTNQEDRMIWRGMTSGIFSVKSTYHLAKEMKKRIKAGCSRELYNSEVWKLLWNLKVPNTEKQFIWRACNDILPIRENLHRRKIIRDPMCPICGLEVETTLHILWECPSTTDVWGVSSKRFQKSCFTEQSFFRIFEEIGRKNAWIKIFNCLWAYRGKCG